MIMKLSFAALLLLAYIAWALPVVLLGLLVCACALVFVVLTEAIYACVKKGKRRDDDKVPVYLFHLSKSALGIPFQATLVLAAVVCALFCYRQAVDSGYRKVSDAYSKVNVFRDTLRKSPLVEWTKDDEAEDAPERIDLKSGGGLDGVAKARACFIEVLREMNLVDPEEFLKIKEIENGRKELDYSTFQNQDGVKWLAEHLFPEGDDGNVAEARFSPVDEVGNNATLRMILEVAMKLHRDEYNKKQPEYYNDNVVILSGVLSGEPGAYDAYRKALFTKFRYNEVASAEDDYANTLAKLYTNLKKTNFGDDFSIRSDFGKSWKSWFSPSDVLDDKDADATAENKDADAIAENKDTDSTAETKDKDSTAETKDTGSTAENKAEDAIAKNDDAENRAKFFANLKTSFSLIRSDFGKSLKTWFLPGDVPDDKEILNLVFFQEKVFENNSVADIRFLDNDYDNTSNKGLNRADVLFIQQFCLEALSKVHENEDVKAAKRVLSVFLGPEQFFMFIVFFICIFTIMSRLFLRRLNERRCKYLPLTSDETATRFQLIDGTLPSSERRAPIIQAMRDQMFSFVDYVYPATLEVYERYSEDQARERDVAVSDYLDYIMGYCNAIEQRSRWIINWAAVTLPAVGFIGTVRGMLLALGNADSIVRATTPAAQAAAITNVATSLSLAFTTTLVALFLGLIITLLNFWQIKQEKNCLSELDRSLRRHFNLLNPTRGDESSSDAPETTR